MERFEVNILGCGAAFPNQRHMTSGQLVCVHNERFMVDCGEGIQAQIWKFGFKTANLNHIFISHAHVDHFYGLLPFVSSLDLIQNRKSPLHIWLPEDLKEPLEYDFTTYCKLSFPLLMHGIDTCKAAVLYDGRNMTVESIPLNHRTPCCGFLFREKKKPRVLLPQKCLALGIPQTEFGRIKAGADWRKPDGTVIPNSELTTECTFQPRSYAYCSDTSYNPAMIPQIQGTTLLYHEATYLQSEIDQAEKYGHSTAAQAAATARAAAVKQLLIGHFSSRYDDDSLFLKEAQAIFPNTIASNEGMTVEVV
ncbi:MAG: ribonuclease Z [Bacteroidaceae bacterium]|nr:ribonuclease Z [Bacteroidaceae bacterium]